MKKELLVGLVFLLAVALALFGTVVVSGLDIFAKKATWYLNMKDVSGLKAGDDVRVLGYRMGVVHRVRYDSEKNLYRVSLRMNADARIYADYHIITREASALGGRFLDIDPGSREKGPANIQDLQGEPSTANVVVAMTDVMDELKKTVSAINSGEGTLGKIIMRDDLYRDMRDAASSLKVVAERLESGQGSVGRLINEDEVYVQLKEVMEKLNNGNGALARLMQDDSGSIVEDLRSAAANVRSITAKADEGSGTVGRLINDATLYENFNEFARHASSVSAKVDDGSGTLGRLVNDPTIYDQVKKLLANAIDSIENARDSAPVSAVTSFIFGPFQ